MYSTRKRTQAQNGISVQQSNNLTTPQPVNKQTQKIQKIQNKNRNRNNSNNSSCTPKKKSQNWKPGRPSKQENIYENKKMEKALSQQWFGSDITSNLLIFLSLKGNLICKVKTGQPAVKTNITFIQNFEDNSKALDAIKKFKRQYRIQMKEKLEKILEHLNYTKDTTLFFLNNNQNCTEQFDILCEISQVAKHGLQLLMKYLDKKFIDTYKLIITKYLQNTSNLNITDEIVKELKQNPINHRMIFDMQLIQELMKYDQQVLKQIETNPPHAEMHQIFQTSVIIPNFESRTFKDQEEDILNQSIWITNFIDEFISILKSIE